MVLFKKKAIFLPLPRQMIHLTILCHVGYNVGMNHIVEIIGVRGTTSSSISQQNLMTPNWTIDSQKENVDDVTRPSLFFVYLVFFECSRHWDFKKKESSVPIFRELRVKWRESQANKNLINTELGLCIWSVDMWKMSTWIRQGRGHWKPRGRSKGTEAWKQGCRTWHMEGASRSTRLDRQKSMNLGRVSWALTALKMMFYRKQGGIERF